MVDSIKIPEALQNTFNRLYRRIPADLRNDTKLLESIVTYLKLGGEKLARQSIAVAVERHKEEVKIMKKKLREEAMIKAAAMLEAGETQDEDDEDNEEDSDEDFDDSEEFKTPGFLE